MEHVIINPSPGSKLPPEAPRKKTGFGKRIWLMVHFFQRPETVRATHWGATVGADCLFSALAVGARLGLPTFEELRKQGWDGIFARFGFPVLWCMGVLLATFGLLEGIGALRTAIASRWAKRKALCWIIVLGNVTLIGWFVTAAWFRLPAFRMDG